MSKRVVAQSLLLLLLLLCLLSLSRARLPFFVRETPASVPDVAELYETACQRVADEALPATCDAQTVEQWIQSSDLSSTSQQIVLDVLKEEEVTSVSMMLEMFEVLKTRDSYKRLPLGSARVFEERAYWTRNVDNMDSGRSALMLAADEGRTEVVRYLLEKGANVDLQDGIGYTALIRAACRTEVVRALLEKGASLDIQGQEDGETALMRAVRSGGAGDAVRALLEKGANVDLQNNKGQTALIIAHAHPYEQRAHVGRGDTSFIFVVRALLEKGANTDLQDKDGSTALILAAQEGDLFGVMTLLEKGAKADIQDRNGLTSLTWAALQGHTEVVRALLERGEGIGIQTIDHALAQAGPRGGFRAHGFAPQGIIEVLQSHRKLLEARQG